MAQNVLVAMSGGVDSSVAAVLLQKEDYDVAGAVMRLFEARDGCGTDTENEAEKEAAAVASRLEIPFYVFDLKAEFERCVIRRFVSEYECGRTPNPCIDCNRFIKFGAFFDKADSLGYRFIATGHYAKVEPHGSRYLLKKGADAKKDQSYMLFSLTQDKLARVILPLGGLKKREVRELARENGFSNAERGDSQDICFLPEGDHAGFIERLSGKKSRPGDIVDIYGNKLGEHSGITRYTVGQRRGLRISSGGRLFVKELDIETNTVILGDNASLFAKRLVAEDINLIAADTLDYDVRITAKIRYAHAGALATARQTGENEMTVIFDEPQRAITKGQYVVLYDGETVLGGGTIKHVGD